MAEVTGVEGRAAGRRWVWWLAGLALAAGMAAILHSMGRNPICTCGYVKFWEGEANGPGNSQHIADWYTFSHVIHGFLFYAAARWLMPRTGAGPKLLAAMAVEALWEIAENSPAVIDRYRTATIALGYEGDSILNSVSDLGFMVVGFALAARLPVWVTVTLAIGFELTTLAVIRDNLALNVLMLVWPLEAVRTWQAG